MSSSSDSEDDPAEVFGDCNINVSSPSEEDEDDVQIAPEEEDITTFKVGTNLLHKKERDFLGATPQKGTEASRFEDLWQ